MSESTAEEKEESKDDAEEGGEDKEEKKGRPWKRILLGVGVLVVVIVAAVVVLGGSKKKAPPGGTLTVGKQQLLPLSTSGKLAAEPGQEVVGKKMVVRTIVRGHGFWVGGSNVNRVYVEYAGPSNTVGGTVQLHGTVKPAPPDAQKTLKLSQEDAAKVTAEGAFINASTVSPGPPE